MNRKEKNNILNKRTLKTSTKLESQSCVNRVLFLSMFKSFNEVRSK